MANYAYVENGKVIKEHNRLPKSWKNISGFNLLEGNTDALIAQGWYSISYTPPEYDANTSYVSGYTYTVQSDIVIKQGVVVDYTQEELQQIEDRFFQKVRRIRDGKLTDCDWTMMVDVRAQQTAEWITAWETYRQELRDLPQSLAGTTDFNIDNVVWPTIPA